MMYGCTKIGPMSVDINIFIPVLRRRLLDMYIGSWKQEIDTKSSLILFRSLKQFFEISDYLIKMHNVKLRNIISKIRMSSHDLNIEIGRHRQIERNEPKCTLWDKNDIEDEYHFILICPVYTTLRNHYIPTYYYKKANHV